MIYWIEKAASDATPRRQKSFKKSIEVCSFFKHKERIYILFICHNHSHSHGDSALSNVYPVALESARR